MDHAAAPAVGMGNSVTVPDGVMRPTWLAFMCDAVNHRLPSGPTASPRRCAGFVGTGNSVRTPAVVMRPILLPVSSVNHSAPPGPEMIVRGRALAGIGN